MRLKDAGFHLNSEGAQASDEFFVKPVGVLGRRGLGVGRPAASFCVAVERELRNDKGGTPDLNEGAVHFAGIVCEDAQISDFLRKIQSRLNGIVAAHAEQDQHARLNFPGYASVDCDAGSRNTLDDGAQDVPLFRRAPSRRRATRPPTRRREARCSGGRRSEQRGEREARAMATPRRAPTRRARDSTPKRRDSVERFPHLHPRQSMLED